MVGREKELTIHFVPGSCRLVEVKQAPGGAPGPGVLLPALGGPGGAMACVYPPRRTHPFASPPAACAAGREPSGFRFGRLLCPRLGDAGALAERRPCRCLSPSLLVSLGPTRVRLRPKGKGGFRRQ